MKAYEIVTDVLKLMAENAKPDVVLNDLDKMAEARIIELGGIPFNKNYTPLWTKIPYPKATCISVNNVIVHGIPDNSKLRDGDIVSFDIGVKKDDLCGDAALTVGVGTVSKQDIRLMDVAKKTLYAAIKEVKEGVSVYRLSKIMEQSAFLYGCRVNKNYAGHGIGKEMHQGPEIPNWVKLNPTEDERHIYEYVLKAGEMICLEPMVTYGADDIGMMLLNGWTVVTRDSRNSAVFEHQLLVKKGGCEILTKHFEYNED